MQSRAPVLGPDPPLSLRTKTPDNCSTVRRKIRRLPPPDPPPARPFPNAAVRTFEIPLCLSKPPGATLRATRLESLPSWASFLHASHTRGCQRGRAGWQRQWPRFYRESASTIFDNAHRPTRRGPPPAPNTRRNVGRRPERRRGSKNGGLGRTKSPKPTGGTTAPGPATVPNGFPAVSRPYHPPLRPVRWNRGPWPWLGFRPGDRRSCRRR